MNPHTLDDAKKCVGVGWHSLLEQIFAEIEKVDKTVIVEYVKEKFGGLRVCASGCSDELDAFIWEICDKSLMICEFCGKEGYLIAGGTFGKWVKAVCVEHEPQWKAGTLKV